VNGSWQRLAPVLLIVVALAGGWAGARDRTFAAPDTAGETVEISDEERRAGLTFDPGMRPEDRAWILAAIAQARPEAQRLIAEVDGRVQISTHSSAATGLPLGVVTYAPRGFAISFDRDALNGRRVADRNMAVLHELGHAIDFALVPQDVNAALEQGIPRGPCVEQPGTPTGSCAEPEERFADTFAKWALRGAVSVAGAGYGVATPPSLEDWGAPLGALSAQLPPAG
jgi:hypothetical protein